MSRKRQHSDTWNASAATKQRNLSTSNTHSQAILVGSHYWLPSGQDNRDYVLRVTNVSPLQGDVFRANSTHNATRITREWIKDETYDKTTIEAEKLGLLTLPIVTMENYGLNKSVWFSRSTNTTTNGIQFATNTQNCAACQGPMDSPPVYCRVCERFMHRDCALNDGFPMQIKDGYVVDHTGKPISCCLGKKEDPAHDLQSFECDRTTSRKSVSICIDIGSTKTKVSVILGDQNIHVRDMIVPAIFVHEEQFLTSQSFDEMFHTRPDARRFSPLKRFLVSGESSLVSQQAQSALKNGLPEARLLHEVFTTFLNNLLADIAKHSEDQVSNYLAKVKMPGFRLAVALPAGLLPKNNEIFLTALLHAGQLFGKQFPQLNTQTPEICQMSEAAMSLTKDVQTDDERTEAMQDAGSTATALYHVVVDVGGSTADACVIEGGSGNLCIASQTKVCGNICLVENLIAKSFLNESCDGQYSSILNWAIRYSSNSKIPIPLPTVLKAEHVTQFEKLRDAQVKGFADFCLDTMKQAREFIQARESGRSLEELVELVKLHACGGGLTDDAMAASYEKATAEVFPGSELQRNRNFSTESTVLKGLAEYVRFSALSAYDQSPWTIVAIGDRNHDEHDEHKVNVLYINQGDPMGPHPLWPPNRLRRGEFVCWNVTWEAQSSATTDIPLIALRKRLDEAPLDYTNLDNAVTADLEKYQQEIIPITTIQIPRQKTNNLYISVVLNVLGSTLHVKVLGFDDVKDDVQIEDPALEATFRKPSLEMESIYALQLYKLNGFVKDKEGPDVPKE